MTFPCIWLFQRRLQHKQLKKPELDFVYTCIVALLPLATLPAGRREILQHSAVECLTRRLPMSAECNLTEVAWRIAPWIYCLMYSIFQKDVSFVAPFLSSEAPSLIMRVLEKDDVSIEFKDAIIYLSVGLSQTREGTKWVYQNADRIPGVLDRVRIWDAAKYKVQKTQGWRVQFPYSSLGGVFLAGDDLFRLLHEQENELLADQSLMTPAISANDLGVMYRKFYRLLRKIEVERAQKSVLKSAERRQAEASEHEICVDAVALNQSQWDEMWLSATEACTDDFLEEWCEPKTTRRRKRTRSRPLQARQTSEENVSTQDKSKQDGVENERKDWPDLAKVASDDLDSQRKNVADAGDAHAQKATLTKPRETRTSYETPNAWHSKPKLQSSLPIQKREVPLVFPSFQDTQTLCTILETHLKLQLGLDCLYSNRNAPPPMPGTRANGPAARRTPLFCDDVQRKMLHDSGNTQESTTPVARVNPMIATRVPQPTYPLERGDGGNPVSTPLLSQLIHEGKPETQLKPLKWIPKSPRWKAKFEALSKNSEIQHIGSLLVCPKDSNFFIGEGYV